MIKVGGAMRNPNYEEKNIQLYLGDYLQMVRAIHPHPNNMITLEMLPKKG